MSKLSHLSKIGTIADALKYIKSNQTLLCGGFGLSGIPETYFAAIAKQPGIKNLTIVSNNGGLNHIGSDKLIEAGQVSRMIMSYMGRSKPLMNSYLSGKIEIELTPQGTISERCRAAASGIPAFYTKTGADTWIEQGKMPVKYNDKGEVIKYSQAKETRVFNGKKYLLEEALPGDVALVKCWKADALGNLVFRGTTLNFNQVFAQAAAVTLVEADEIVPVGSIEPNEVHVPGIHVTKVIQSTEPKHIESLQLARDHTKSDNDSDPRVVIARRVAKEFENGSYANLGIGLPTLAPNYIDPNVSVVFQSENGILGVGPYPTESQVDPDIVNAGKETVTLLPGASVFGSQDSFAMIRAGKINCTVLGAMEVSQYGDLANWGVPGNIKGMGGAMDLVSNPEETKVVVCTTHTTKDGKPKIVKQCSNPLTGSRVARVIITELAVFKVDNEGLVLTELQPGATLEEVKSKTDAPFREQLSSSPKL